MLPRFLAACRRHFFHDLAEEFVDYPRFYDELHSRELEQPESKTRSSYERYLELAIEINCFLDKQDVADEFLLIYQKWKVGVKNSKKTMFDMIKVDDSQEEQNIVLIVSIRRSLVNTSKVNLDSRKLKGSKKQQGTGHTGTLLQSLISSKGETENVEFESLVEGVVKLLEAPKCETIQKLSNSIISYRYGLSPHLLERVFLIQSKQLCNDFRKTRTNIAIKSAASKVHEEYPEEASYLPQIERRILEVQCCSDCRLANSN